MSETNSPAKDIAQVFIDYCEEEKYQFKLSEESINLRLEISNLKDRAIVNIYHTSKIVVQGSKSSLKIEMEKLKKKYNDDPNSFFKREILKEKSCSARYDIMLSKLRNDIKESLNELGASLEITNNPNSNTEYKAKLKRNASSLTLSQFNNGTLILQGKTNHLFEECCDTIEKIAKPTDKEVIARFISGDEKSLEFFTERYSPKLIDTAEKIVKEKIGIVYEFLELHDKKWFVASECLCLTKIPLPEYSPMVMPASKAFEGFAKKLLIGIGLVEQDHFKTKNSSFSPLNTVKDPKRIVICEKEKYAETWLKELSVSLEFNRNFMMHSDDSKITKVNSLEEAEKKVEKIFNDTKEIFEYFNDNVCNLSK